MELDEQFTERVKTIIVDQLPPALIKLWEEKGPAMQAAITADVVNRVRGEVRKDHSENRTRLQSIEKTVSEAVREASSADTKATEILTRVNEHYDMASQTAQAVQALSSQVSSLAGEKAGVRTERSRWVAVGKAAAAIVTSGGLLKLAEFLTARH